VILHDYDDSECAKLYDSGIRNPRLAGGRQQFNGAIPIPSKPLVTFVYY
jgi:hypothetical protein